jgi:replicative DNA helicase
MISGLPSDPFRDRKPPFSEDAEQAVLSAMLNDPEAIVAAAEVVDDSMFYAEKHRRLFRAIVALAEKGSRADPITLSEELIRRGELEASGGKEYIGFVVDAAPTSANVAYHAEIVRDKATLRKLIATGTEMVRSAFDGNLPPRELLDAAEASVMAVAEQSGRSGPVRVKDGLWDVMRDIEERARSGRSVTGVASGFTDLDEMTAGFQKSDLIILAGRPSMGKTAFALNIAQHAAMHNNVGVVVFSLEMSTPALTERVLASEARIDSQRIRRGFVRDHEFPLLAKAAGVLSAAPLWIDDTSVATTLDIRSRARRLMAEHKGLGLVIVDYLQLMTGTTKAENRNQEVSGISRGLKALAKELGVPVIALSQLSRASEQRGGDHRPQLSDLRESGAIEQDADLVMFVHRPEMYKGPRDSEGNDIEGQAELIIGKQRNGPIGSVRLHFQKSLTRFENWTPRHEPRIS